MRHLSILTPIVYGTLYVLSLLPRRVLYSTSGLFYIIGWRIFGYRKSTIIQNLSRSFPDKKYSEIDSIADQYARHLFLLFAEWLKSMSESRSSLEKRMIFRNKKLLEGDQNVFLMLGHYGNWECLSILPFITNKPVYAVYKQQTSAVADSLSHKMRKRFGVKLLESRDAARYVLQNKVPSVYIFISDQSPSHLSKVKLSFMNQPTLAFEGVERLVRITKGNVLYTEIAPQDRGRYEISFQKIESQTDITETFFELLEQTINTQPQYWLWSHRRWKHLL